jgi:hypothetical protein
MSDTPRTEEALIDNADLCDEGHGKSNMVKADFARQLEKETIWLRQSLHTNSISLKSWNDTCEKLERENARLNDLLNPRMWTLEMSTAWHKNIPDVHAAFAALRSLPNTEV